MTLLKTANRLIYKYSRAISTHRVIIETTGQGSEQLEELLWKIKEVGGTGHSFGIYTDDKPPVKLGSWDGDGSSVIVNLKSEKI